MYQESKCNQNYLFRLLNAKSDNELLDILINASEDNDFHNSDMRDLVQLAGMIKRRFK